MARMSDEQRLGTERSSLRRLFSGVLWNALGRGLPLMVALLLTPWLLHLMGLERWGLFTLALAMVGVLGVLDLGVGPALTRTLSERMATDTAAEQAALVRAGLAALGLVSVAGAVALFMALPWLVQRVLNVPPALQAEALAAMRVLACAIPLVVLNAALWGVLAAHQRFAAANLVTVPVNLFYYLGPVLALLVWDSLIGVMLALLACRLANTVSYVWLVRRDVPGLWSAWPRLGLATPLLRLGGWITFASLIGQALLYADRFLIGALLTLTAVAYYATPLDLVLRMWILPVAVSQALLPAMASGFARMPVETAGLLRRGGLLILLGVFPACAILIAAPHDILRLWLGTGFADGGAPVLRILAIGILFSCLAYAPNALIEAIGRPDVTARFVLGQALVFLPISALCLWLGGIEGAAIAWSFRVAADAAGKLFFAARLYPPAAAAARGLMAPMLGAGAALVAVAALGWPALPPGGALVAILLWRALLPAERQVLRHLLRHPGQWRQLIRA